MQNGSCNIFYIKFSNDDSIEFIENGFEKMETEDSFSNRTSANKFKQYLISRLQNSKSSIYNDIMNIIVNILGVEYGFEIDDLINYIKSISPNALYKEI